MSQTQAMRDIMTTLQRAVDEHTAYPLLVDAPGLEQVDPVTQTDPYLKVKVNFLAAEQVELGAPTVRMWGQIWLETVVKAGTSWDPAVTLNDYLFRYFNCQRIGILNCLAVGAMPMKTKDGQDHWPLIVNFYYHKRG